MDTKCAIHSFHSAKHAKEAAQQFLFTTLAQRNGAPVLWLCTGGGSMELLDEVPPFALGDWLTLAVTDERMSTEPEISNFLQLKATPLGQAAQKAGAHFISTVPLEEQTLESWADAYEAALRNWVASHPDGLIMMTLGIGRDGHTIGIMPYPEDPVKFDRLFLNSPRWVVGYDVKDKNPFRLRLTLTPAFLRQHVDETVVYHVGEEKQQSFVEVFQIDGPIAEVPGRIVHSLPSVMVFTDRK